MKDTIQDDLRAELDRMRGRLDHLRVQANLGKKELADKLREFGDELEPNRRRAMERIASLAKSTARETEALAKGLQAGWEELWHTYRELSREAQDEKRADSRRK